jgi:hypothetical protein
MRKLPTIGDHEIQRIKDDAYLLMLGCHLFLSFSSPPKWPVRGKAQALDRSCGSILQLVRISYVWTIGEIIAV